MSYFDDNEDRFTGTSRRRYVPPAPINRKAMAARPGSELAAARSAAHAAFDPLWQTGRFTRGVAYEWLASELGIEVARCHMVLFDLETCQRVIALCKTHPACAVAAAEYMSSDFEDLTK